MGYVRQNGEERLTIDCAKTKGRRSEIYRLENGMPY
jgi:hypothetical protein